MGTDDQSIQRLLLEYSEQIDPHELFPSLENGATNFALNNPYAFCLATCLDRGTIADIFWTIPYWMFKDLGHLDPHKINLMPLEKIFALVARLPKKPRYIKDAPRTIQEITKIVIDDYAGDASQIWVGKRAFEVRSVFREVYGVGPGIANMAVLLIEKAYGVHFSDVDRKKMDIKPDIHTRRVLFRLGVALVRDNDGAINAARRLNPTFPGGIDGALWLIGRKWCRETSPDCDHCFIQEVCPKVID
jgi:endonuclease III